MALARDPEGGLPTWACPTCGSRATTIEALRHVVSVSAATSLWVALTGDAGAPRSAIGCPACGEPMHVVTLRSAAHALELDACRPCHVLWFAPREIEVLSLFPPDVRPEPPSTRDMPEPARVALAAFLAGQIRERAGDEGVGNGASELDADDVAYAAAVLFKVLLRFLV